ncbi:MAG: hypothetical protein UV38_C0002G0285 [candidate division TM6 bacterium GW2011_GWE2_42_60]|nr:MAG: hypothetical protein UV38_C0002G0285 [candidate division TM6 bacterium GW2011_GWE2_42_60]HBY05963.1 hypothetical protein [Candidatus Dependentiae bacterium]
MGIADSSSSVLFNLIVFLIALAFCSLFSFLETSMMALRLFQLKELAQRTGRYHELFRALEKDPNRLLNAILIAYNLANYVAAVSGSYFVDEVLASLPSTIRYTISMIAVTAAILFIGDILPKNIVKNKGEKFFASTLWLTNITYYLMYPFVSILNRFTNTIVRFFLGASATDEEPIASEKEIQFLISYIDEKGLMDPEKTNMLQSIFRLGTTAARDIMVPTPDIIMVEANKSIQDAHQIFKKCQFSRLPVYKDDVNNVIGMLHFKDLLSLIVDNVNKTVKEVMRPIMFIPESIRINQLLSEFKAKHMHIAMIINEHGSITGLVTLEDILEEIVGEIHDEYESITEKIFPLPSGGWLADASIELDKISQTLKIQFERPAGVTTLGGFIIEYFQHFPERGEKIHYKGHTFDIQQTTRKKILQVLITLDEKTTDLPVIPPVEKKE